MTSSDGDTEFIHSDEFARLQSQEEQVFGRLIPVNTHAKRAVSWFQRWQARLNSLNMGMPISPDDAQWLKNLEYHSQFMEIVEHEGLATACFKFSLQNLPGDPTKGWRIGRGRLEGQVLDVDLLLQPSPDTDDVAQLHARFAWRKGYADLFLVADTLRNNTTRLGWRSLHPSRNRSGTLESGFGVIPGDNTISIGEVLLFTFQYTDLSRSDDIAFQEELRGLLSKAYGEPHPLVLPTPRTEDSALGDWRVRHILDRGGYGKVVMVTHKRTGEVAAAKTISRQTARGAAMDPNFETEVRMSTIVMDLSHPRIASPIHVFEIRGRSPLEEERVRAMLDPSWNPRYQGEYALILPYIPGVLVDMIKSPMVERVREASFRQILEGIAFLHSKGISHRDLKPANIGVLHYDPPDCKIIDFGCASMEESILYDRPGTVIYLAPEQQDGLYHGREVDTWAAGIIGAELLGWQHRDRLLPGQNLEVCREWLEGRIAGSTPTSSIARACLRLLVEDPRRRLSADKAIKDIDAAQVTPDTSAKRAKRQRRS